MNNGGLQSSYNMSQSEVAEKLFLSENTIQRIEQVAKEKFRKALSDRCINIKDLLPNQD